MHIQILRKRLVAAIKLSVLDELWFLKTNNQLYYEQETIVYEPLFISYSVYSGFWIGHRDHW